MAFSWLDAESSALTAIVLSGSTAYDDEGAIGTNDTTSAILKITRKAISEMRVLFFTETTSNRRKMLHQTCAKVWMEVYRIAPWFGLRLAGAFAVAPIFTVHVLECIRVISARTSAITVPRLFQVLYETIL